MSNLDSPITIEDLVSKATSLRRAVLKAVRRAGRGHLGGALSIIELLVAVYFSGIFQFQVSGVRGRDDDVFHLSKGHAGVAWYAALVELGILREEDLLSMNSGGLLAEHPSPNIPGVNFLSGSLGHGLSLAAGVALSGKLDSSLSRSIVVLGDGELYEGSIWEAAQFAGHHHLNQLCAIVDVNGLITHGPTEGILSHGRLRERWDSLGWHVIEINGHDFGEILPALMVFASGQFSKPCVILSHTIKGKGVSFMENQASWHHGALSDEQLELALVELGGGD